MTKEQGYLLALDQGTTSTRAMVFDLQGRVLARHQIELKQYFPKPGWVEHDPEEIWQASVKVIRQVLKMLAGQTPLALGITNQRETTVLWDRKTGKTVSNAIVWQDRRTSKLCRTLAEAGHEDKIRQKTGLLLDPYFSATKLKWLLDHNPDFRSSAGDGTLAFGTIESFLFYRLTGGRHATDATNASRTMLFNINDGAWDDELLDLFEVPRAVLPEVIENAFEPVPVKKGLFEANFPVSAMIGDQQSAAVGQGCISKGAIKSTYGTGCFVLQNTGGTPAQSENRLLATLAYKLDGKMTYALEGSIFIAGAVVQWLRDGLGIIESAGEIEGLVRSMAGNQGVYMVPAFTGLGAPHWDPDARGAILGLTRDAGPEHLARAALESVAYQTHDLFEAFAADSGSAPPSVRVDGGMVENTWFVQFLSDILGVPVERPKVAETTALGAAFLAGLGAGVYNELNDITSFWELEASYKPEMSESVREVHLKGWRDALQRVLSKPA